MRCLRSCRGFSLIEVVVVLVILATMAALIVPTLAGLVQRDKETATREQVEKVWRAIFGDPTKGEFGYVGDMGRLPTTLTELVDGTGQVAFHTDDGGVEHIGRLGTGWRGPYLRDWFSNSDLLSDAWGRPLTFANAQVTSSGPDGDVATTADNIVFPVHAPVTTGTLFVTVLGNRIPNPLGATTKLYSPVNGEQTATATRKHCRIPPIDAALCTPLSTENPFDGFVYENLTPGLHALRVQHTGRVGDTGPCVTVTRVVAVAVHAGRQVVREVRMINSANVKVADNDCPIPD